MKTRKEIKVKDLLNEKKTIDLSNYILSNSKKQSRERKIRNELLSIRFQLEDYLENDNYSQTTILDFVKMYCKALNISQKRLAELFEMKDSNLHKYLVGERKLNPDLILKLSSFSHTKPELWFGIQVKNELFEINQEKKRNKEYSQYDYENLLVAEP